MTSPPFGSPAALWPGWVSRSASFENREAAVGAGGTAAGGRKGAANRILSPGERVVLADVEGPGQATHLWMTIGPLALEALSPAVLRAQVIEVLYDGQDEPSLSVPAGDLFGAVHGVGASYASALTAVNEERGFDCRIPMPFRRRLRMEYLNASSVPVILYYQLDLLLGPVPDDVGILHAAFRRENPTTLTRDFVIADGLAGPGRFLGATMGVRIVADDEWWGEGEVKVYLDGEDQPTICGTGTEDYLGSAWGLGRFASPESGAPLVDRSGGGHERSSHRLVSMYRWHLSDPIVFDRSARVTVQQIGSVMLRRGQEAAYERLRATITPAGDGWLELPPPDLAFALYERSDDWCATAFTYCQRPQPVERVDVTAAAADLPAEIGFLEG